jgi:hypothetical protein
MEDIVLEEVIDRADRDRFFPSGWMSTPGR